MNLKYEEELSRIDNCPPAKITGANKSAFRFVFNTIDNEKNFLPLAIRNPSRTYSNDYYRCYAHALSLFSTKEKAIE